MDRRTVDWSLRRGALEHVVNEAAKGYGGRTRAYALRACVGYVRDKIGGEVGPKLHVVPDAFLHDDDEAVLAFAKAVLEYHGRPMAEDELLAHVENLIEWGNRVRLDVAMLEGILDGTFAVECSTPGEPRFMVKQRTEVE